MNTDTYALEQESKVLAQFEVVDTFQKYVDPTLSIEQISDIEKMLNDIESDCFSDPFYEYDNNTVLLACLLEFDKTCNLTKTIKIGNEYVEEWNYGETTSPDEVTNLLLSYGVPDKIVSKAEELYRGNMSDFMLCNTEGSPCLTHKVNQEKTRQMELEIRIMSNKGGHKSHLPETYLNGLRARIAFAEKQIERENYKLDLIDRTLSGKPFVGKEATEMRKIIHVKDSDVFNCATKYPEILEKRIVAYSKIRDRLETEIQENKRILEEETSKEDLE